MGKHSGAVFTQNKNTVENNESCLVEPASNEICLTESVLTNTIPVIESGNAEQIEEKSLNFIEPSDNIPQLDLEDFELTSDHINLLENFEQYEFKEHVNNEGLKYIACYVAYRYRNKYSYLGIPTKDIPKSSEPDWLHFLSKSNLMYPNSQLIEATFIMEKEFNSLHGPSLSSEKSIFKKLATRTNDKLPQSFSIPFEVLCCLARTRTYIRLRFLNRNLNFQNFKRSWNRKMSKFTNSK